MQAENLYAVTGFVNRAVARQKSCRDRRLRTFWRHEHLSMKMDGGRTHDAPLVHFVLCDTSFNSSWSWFTRRCEVISIGDRDHASQIRVIPRDENPNAWQSGTWIPRQCCSSRTLRPWTVYELVTTCTKRERHQERSPVWRGGRRQRRPHPHCRVVQVYHRLHVGEEE